MARSITAASGKTNRRFLLLALFAAGMSAILVYVALSNTSREGGAGGVTTVPAVVAKTDIPARTQVTASMVELRQVPANARSELAYTDLAQVIGKATRFPIATNEQVLSTKVVPLSGLTASTSDSLSFVIPKGMRGISITVSEVVSAGGLVLPGDYVDVVGVFDYRAAAATGEQEEESYFARTILQDVEVLAVAQKVVDAPPAAIEGDDAAAGQRARASEATPNPEATTVTLAVTPEQAQLLFLAEANGSLRLSVRPFGDDDTPEVPFIAKNELVPPDLPKP